MEIENRRRDRIYSFVDLYENVSEIMEKNLTFIIYGNKFLHTCKIGEAPLNDNRDFVCKLWGGPGHPKPGDRTQHPAG
jgi:hypothetical protein